VVRVSERLAGKICLVTGTGGAVGRAIALRFANEGACVVGCDIAPISAQETLDAVLAAGGTMTSHHPCDLTDATQCAALVEHAVKNHHRIDVLVNNAGRVHFNWIEELTDEQWTETIAGELSQVFRVTKAAWPELVKRGGSIINIASLAGWIVFEVLGGLAHAASKGGVIAMTRQLAMEGRNHGIRANSLSPGPLETPTTKQMFQDPNWGGPMLSKIMRGTPGRPEEVAAVALFLASDESSFVNAADIIVDGGASAW
jgi:NAD(P)-dependent dehydrogenase (short-subunit alcohol dehydrogenase family)